MKINEKGVTLLEIVIVLGVLGIVSVSLMSIFVNNAGVFYKETSKVSEGLGSNDALVQTRSYIRQAQMVASSFTNGAVTYTSGSNQLVLALPSYDNAGNVIDKTYDYVVYSTNNSILTLQIFPSVSSKRKSANQVLAKDINSVLFEYFDSMGQITSPPSAVKVKITLTLKQKAGLSSELNIATTEANLRNN